MFFLVFLLVFLFPTSAYAATPKPVAGTSISLSEVFGCKQSDGAEENKVQWIELYNSSNQSVDLNGWKIVKNTTSNNEKTLSGIIEADGYFRIPVGSVTTGFLNQSNGFGFTLVDSQNFVWESFPAEYKDDTSKTVKCSVSNGLMSWIKEGESWMITTSPTASDSNKLVAISTPTPTPSPSPTASATPTPTPTASPSPTPTPTSGPQPTTVSLSEIYACQADGTKEWVELYNSGSAAVTLTNWKLMDDDNNEQPIASLTIPSKGYSTVEITKYARGMLTNDGDVVNLYDATGKKVDSYEYSTCHSDQSWSKINTIWVENTSMTKGKANTPPTSSPTASASAILEGDGDGSVGGEVLGSNTTQEEEPTPTPVPETSEQKGSSSNTMLAILCIGLGVLMLGGVGGYLAWEPYLKKKILPLLGK